MEIWKSDGSQYPPALRSLLSGVNYVLQKKAPFSIPKLGKGDYRFKDLLHTLDSLCSDLHRQGIEATKNSAKVIELDLEA